MVSVMASGCWEGEIIDGNIFSVIFWYLDLNQGELMKRFLKVQ